jgi:hypothetical protein
MRVYFVSFRMSVTLEWSVIDGEAVRQKNIGVGRIILMKFYKSVFDGVSLWAMTCSWSQ